MTIPSIAAAAGYNERTFGPDLELGRTWFLHNFFKAAVPGTAIQNGDGSITLPGTGNGYGICSAQKLASGAWQGQSFGGGAYIEAVFSHPATAAAGTPWPAFWLVDIETLSLNANSAANQQPNQPPGTGNWVELDAYEYDASAIDKYGACFHNWYGKVGSGNQVSTKFAPISVLPSTVDKSNRVGLLWIPATANSPGSATYYYNGLQKATVPWSLYNPLMAWPPVYGTTAFSVLDQRHLVPVFNTGIACPMEVRELSIWQASSAGNLSQ